MAMRAGQRWADYQKLSPEEKAKRRDDILHNLYDKGAQAGGGGGKMGGAGSGRSSWDSGGRYTGKEHLP